jgi:catechol 2,3-dioxygenase-like lactoylglutathione lyase family enzyme
LKTPNDLLNVRAMVNDVQESIDFYTERSWSAGQPTPDGRRPAPGGWNRVDSVVADVNAEIQRLRDAGLRFRNGIVTGPGGQQIMIDDPSASPVELFQPAGS